MNSLEINVDRLFIDEIDNVGNFINQSFNTKFIMFISASFSLQNNNGYYSKKLQEQKISETVIQKVEAKGVFEDNYKILPFPHRE